MAIQHPRAAAGRRRRVASSAVAAGSGGGGGASDILMTEKPRAVRQGHYGGDGSLAVAEIFALSGKRRGNTPRQAACRNTLTSAWLRLLATAAEI